MSQESDSVIVPFAPHPNKGFQVENKQCMQLRYRRLMPTRAIALKRREVPSKGAIPAMHTSCHGLVGDVFVAAD